MSVDYQIIAFRRPASLTQVGIYQLDPLALEVLGTGFLDTAEVLLNGRRVTDFIVTSNTRLLLGVPDDMAYSPIEELVVILSASSDSPGTTSILDFRSSVTGAMASGMGKLIQNYVTLLLKSPNTDIFSTSGGGVLSLVGVQESSGLKAAVSVAVRNAANQLIRMQAQESVLSANEKLASATLLSSAFDARKSTLNVQIRLVAVDGSTASVTTSV